MDFKLLAASKHCSSESGHSLPAARRKAVAVCCQYGGGRHASRCLKQGNSRCLQTRMVLPWGWAVFGRTVTQEAISRLVLSPCLESVESTPTGCGDNVNGLALPSRWLCPRSTCPVMACCQHHQLCQTPAVPPPAPSCLLLPACPPLHTHAPHLLCPRAGQRLGLVGTWPLLHRWRLAALQDNRQSAQHGTA